MILLTDRRAAASDTLATSYILSQAVRTIGRYDFVFCGRQAIDGDTAQVGPQCAEKLGIPQITYLEQVRGFAAARSASAATSGHGWEIVEAELPVLVTVVQTANDAAAAFGQAGDAGEAGAGARRGGRGSRRMRCPPPPRPTRPPRPSAAWRPCKQQGLLIEQWNLDDIHADLERCGLAGSPTKVFRIQAIVLTKEGYTEIPPTARASRQLIHELVVDRTMG